LHVPGSAATIVVIAFFAAVNLIGLDVIGAFVRRAFNEQEMVGSARADE
jgi:hypothetical protein